jgi:hypothetical protein
MPKKEKISKIEIISLEKGNKKDSLKVTCTSKDRGIGNYFFEIDKKEKSSCFLPGKVYKALFEIQGLPDFIGEKDKWENVSTVSYILKKIYSGNEIIYELKNKFL